MTHLVRWLIIISLSASIAQAAVINYADPDLISMGYEYYGSPSIKIGDYVEFHNFRLGGFIETRNEDRFEQGPLPNHNWRGFGFLRYFQELYQGDVNRMTLMAGFEHESAHPTGGFHENNDEAYEMIYDEMYRNINLNSFSLGIGGSTTGRVRLRYLSDYRVYVFSRNTPELHDNALTQSHGISAGLELLAGISSSVELFVSLFDRRIFAGDKHRPDWIYYDENGVTVTRYQSYPVINDINTVVLKTGILLHREGGARTLCLYGKVLYGNIYGFVDSREERLVFSAGIELTR